MGCVKKYVVLCGALRCVAFCCVVFSRLVVCVVEIGVLEETAVLCYVVLCSFR